MRTAGYFTQVVYCVLVGAETFTHSIRTYEVIPMTSRIGMIEWMANTRVLKEMIMSSMSAEDQVQYRSKREAHDPQVREVACE